jgi:hypothetical protein
MRILEKRVKHLHKSTGSPNLEPAMKSSETPKQLFVYITRPTKILLFSPDVLVFSIIAAIVYGTAYLLFTTMTQVFEDQYGINKSNIGLTYLAMGIGQTIGTITFGLVSDRILARLAEGGEMEPESRLPPLVVGLCLESTGLVWYGSVRTCLDRAPAGSGYICYGYCYFLHADYNVYGRCIYAVCCGCYGGEHRVQEYWECSATAGRAEDVCCNRVGVGEYSTGFYCAAVCADCVVCA